MCVMQSGLYKLKTNLIIAFDGFMLQSFIFLYFMWWNLPITGYYSYAVKLILPYFFLKPVITIMLCLYFEERL